MSFEADAIGKLCSVSRRAERSDEARVTERLEHSVDIARPVSAVTWQREHSACQLDVFVGYSFESRLIERPKA